MSRLPLPTLLFSLVLLSNGIASERHPEPTRSVDDFALLDHTGAFHRLYYHAKDEQTKAIVIFTQGNGCPLVQKQIPELAKLQEHYTNAVFWMLNANSQDTREEIAREAAGFKMPMPILIDETQLVAEALDIKRTAEAIIIQPDLWRIVYRGPISDRFSYQTEKPKAERHYVRETLDALITGKPVEPSVVQAPGCRVNILDDNPAHHQQISYSKTIAPMLINRCVECHAVGGIAPWAMTSYKKVRGWADMMGEVVLTGLMPPWQADPHIGRFSNDLALTPDETKSLIHWIKAGAPRGEGPDPLESITPRAIEWSLGEPDHVVVIPEQSVPAQGVVPYRYLEIDSPFTEDVWVTAVDVRPGNTRVLHHVIATTLELREGKEPRERALAGYAPGVGPDRFPEGTAIRVKQGSKIKLQLHYTASGRTETDRTRIGLYFASKPVATELRGRVIIDSKFKIPPHDREFTRTKGHRFDQDVYLHSMFPHMHYRGKAMTYSALYPDGTREVLLSVPNYHFNWQRSYRLAEPKFLPKGTRLDVEACWDNSSLNTYNPDPSIEVGWGEQSWEEMFFASYRFVAAPQQD